VIQNSSQNHIPFFMAAWKFGGTGQKENTKLEYDEGL
jgi:hypothetical protein